MRAARAFLTAAVAALLASGCTGTSTPALPTLLVVGRTTTPPTLALVAVDLTPTSRALRLVAPTAFTFAAGSRLEALDATPREGVPTAAWVLTSDATGAAAALHRFDLAGLEDDPTTTVTRVGTPFALTDGDRAWAPGLTPGGQGPVCPRQAIVGGPADDPTGYVALWDLCDDAGTPDDGRVHIVNLDSGTIVSLLPFPYDAVGIRAGVSDPATFTTVRVAVGDDRVLETRRFAAPAEPTGVEATLPSADDLLDVSVARGTWWTLVRPPSGDPELRGFAPDATTPSTRPAFAGALRVFVGGGPGVLAFGTGLAQVAFADGTSTPTPVAAVGVALAPAAVAVTVEANDYAVVATASGTLCALDVRVAATSSGCEFVLPAPGLPEARFLTWTYAAPPAP